jgi:hypothetical protein
MEKVIGILPQVKEEEEAVFILAEILYLLKMLEN